jgi:zinc and cadmium transporter
MSPLFPILLSVFIISLASFSGVFLLTFRTTLISKSLLYFVSFSAGALFGDVFLHLLPEVIEEFGFPLSASLSILFGIVLMFIVEKFIHWRHCHHTHEAEHAKTHSFAIMNLIGDGVHNFLDGIIIATSYFVSIPVGIATTIAVMLHEIPQEIGDAGVLLHGGFSKKQALFYNFLSALMAGIGAIIVLLFSQYVEGWLLVLTCISAGGFLYIAGADLIPELHKERRFIPTLFQFVAFISGIAIMALLLLLE